MIDLTLLWHMQSKNCSEKTIRKKSGHFKTSAGLTCKKKICSFLYQKLLISLKNIKPNGLKIQHNKCLECIFWPTNSKKCEPSQG